MSLSRLLVVDDDQDTCLNFQDLLEAADFEVDLAYDGASAVDRLVNGDGYEAVLLDLRLPDFDGIEVYARARDSGRQVPGILVSGYADQTTAQDRGLWQVLDKPVDVERLMQVVEEAALLEARDPRPCRVCGTATPWFHPGYRVSICSSACLHAYESRPSRSGR